MVAGCARLCVCSVGRGNWLLQRLLNVVSRRAWSTPATTAAAAAAAADDAVLSRVTHDDIVVNFAN